MRKRIKIAYDCRHLQKPELDDGASRYSYELLSALAAADGPLELYGIGYRDVVAGTKLEELLDKGIHFLPAFNKRASTAVNYLLAQRSFPELLKKCDADLFHALFQTEVLALAGTPQVVTVHDLGLYYSYPARVRANVERTARIRIKLRAQDALRFRLIKRAKAVLADSEFTRQRLIDLKMAKGGKISVIYPGFNKGFLRQTARGEDLLEIYKISSPYILMVGRLQPYKNILNAIKALKILHTRQDFNGCLLICGSAKGSEEIKYLEACKIAAAGAGLSEKVRFLGYVPDEHLRSLYGKASVFLQASFLEGFGFPPLEAALAGAPVVVSEMGSLPEIVKRAVKVSPFEPASIAEGLKTALRSGAAGTGVTWQTWRDTAVQVMNIYDAVK